MRHYCVIYGVSDIAKVFVEAESEADAKNKADKTMGSVNILNTVVQVGDVIIEFPHYYENYEMLEVSPSD